MNREKVPRNTPLFVAFGLVAAVAVIALIGVTAGRGGSKLKPVERTVDVNGREVAVKAFGAVAKANIGRKFRTEQEIKEYVQSRKKVLEGLALDDPGREIEVVISPNFEFSIEELKLRERIHGLRTTDLALDLYSGGKWDHMVQFDSTSKVIDINLNAADLIARLHEVENVPRPVRNDRRSDPNEAYGKPSFDSIGVRFARGRLKAIDAKNLQEDGAVMLVDPLTDVQDKLSSDYSSVEITDVPQPFVAREIISGFRYAPGNTVRNR